MPNWAFSQKKWSLTECLNYARSKNLQIKQSDLAIESSESTLRLHIQNTLPTINAGIIPNYYFGRAIDATTYQFTNQGLLNGSAYLNSSYTIYNGKKKQNAISMSEIDIETAKLNKKKMVQDIQVQIVQNFMQILMQKEQVSLSNTLLEVSVNQLKTIKKSTNKELIESTPTWEAQVALDELSLVKAQNEVKSSLISLAMLLNLQDVENFDIESKEIVPLNKNENFEDIYRNIYAESPLIQQTFLQQKYLSLQLETVKNESKPSVTAFANVLSYYSNLFKEVSSAKLIKYDTTLFYANKQVQLGVSPVYNYNYSTIPFMTQLGKTLNLNVGVSIVIPIFNGYQHKNNVNQILINIKNTEYAAQISKNNLRKEAFQIYSNLDAAKKQFEAAQKSQLAWKKAFDSYLVKMQNVANNTGEFDTIKMNLVKSEQSLQVSKYDYLLKRLLIQIYEGKGGY